MTCSFVPYGSNRTDPQVSKAKLHNDMCTIHQVTIDFEQGYSVPNTQGELLCSYEVHKKKQTEKTNYNSTLSYLCFYYPCDLCIKFIWIYNRSFSRWNVYHEILRKSITGTYFYNRSFQLLHLDINTWTHTNTCFKRSTTFYLGKTCCFSSR